MRRLNVMLVAEILLAEGWTAFADKAVPSADSPVPLVDLIYQSDEGKARFRVAATMDDKPLADQFRQAQSSYLAVLFKQLDHDGDGRLDPREAAAIPAPEMAVPASLEGVDPAEVRVAVNVSAIDEDSDGFVSPAELTEFANYFGDGAVRLRSVSTDMGVEVALGKNLFQFLDADKDGKLSFKEIDDSSVLFSRDADANGVLSADELGGSRADLNANVRLTEQVAAGPPAKKAFKSATPSDAPADALVSVEFGDSAGGIPNVAAKSELLRGVAWAEGHSTGFILAAMKTHVTIVRLPGRFRAWDTARDSLLSEFDAADGDGDGVAPLSGRLASYLREHAVGADANSDGSLTRAELVAYAESTLAERGQMESSRLTIWTSNKGVGLFALIDRDRDGRLSASELQWLSAHRELFDADQNQALAASEIPASIVITIQQGSLPAPYSGASPQDAGPPWFFRMDRNLDGSIAPAEFLGGTERFVRLDIDGDRLISLEEAIQADAAREPSGAGESK